ncbi:hypothetical protein ACS0TY_005733 [Phlomoides rotata]
MAKTLIQSRRRILPFLTQSRWGLEQPLEPSPWLLNLEVKAPGISYVRFASTQTTSPAQAQRTGSVQVSMTSPGFVYEPYTPREPMSFWHRWFTRSGWKRTKEDIALEIKTAYAIAKLRKKTGYTKKKFYEEAALLYKEINTLLANGDKRLLRKFVTEYMYSALKNEIKHRETVWNHVYWDMIMPIVKIRTLRARLIGVERDNFDKVFAQLTLEFLSKQVIRNLCLQILLNFVSQLYEFSLIYIQFFAVEYYVRTDIEYFSKHIV